LGDSITSSPIHARGEYILYGMLGVMKAGSGVPAFFLVSSYLKPYPFGVYLRYLFRLYSKLTVSSSTAAKRF